MNIKKGAAALKISLITPASFSFGRPAPASCGGGAIQS